MRATIITWCTTIITTEYHFPRLPNSELRGAQSRHQPSHILPKAPVSVKSSMRFIASISRCTQMQQFVSNQLCDLSPAVTGAPEGNCIRPHNIRIWPPWELYMSTPTYSQGISTTGLDFADIPVPVMILSGDFQLLFMPVQWALSILI